MSAQVKNKVCLMQVDLFYSFLYLFLTLYIVYTMVGVWQQSLDSKAMLSKQGTHLIWIQLQRITAIARLLLMEQLSVLAKDSWEIQKLGMG